MRLIDADKLENILSGLEEEYKAPPILDEKEKEFLQYLYDHIRPRIKTISKAEAFPSIPEYEMIEMRFEELDNEDYNYWFPRFPKGSMYRRMEVYKIYTPEELGLEVKK